MKEQPRFHHICEVCGRTEVLTPNVAFAAGWDYPPRMGAFGVISPRVCPSCPITDTIWWLLAMEGRSEDALTDRQREVVARIQGEPGSLRVQPGEEDRGASSSS